MFSTEKRVLQNRLNEQRWLLYSLLGFSVAAIAAPILNPRAFVLPAKYLLVTSGMVAATVSIEQMRRVEQTEELFNTIHRVQQQQLEEKLTTANGLETLRTEFDRKQLALSEILQRPAEIQAWLAATMGIPLPQPLAPELPQLPPAQVTINNSLEAAKNQIPDIDLSYLEQIDVEGRSWIERPALTVGPPRSGKSSILVYRAAAFLIQNPGGRLWIGDIHFSPSRCSWFPGNSPEMLEGTIIATSPEEVYRAACEWEAEFKDRRETKDYSRPWIKLMIDEANDTLQELSKGQREHLVQIIEGGTRQGPKYKCSIDIGLHDMKTGGSGLDSSTLRSMDWYLLGSTICDTTIKFPRNFNLEALVVDWQLLGNRVPHDVARPLVFWGHQEPFPTAELMPFLVPPPIELSFGPDVQDRHQAKDWPTHLKQAESNEDWWKRYNQYLDSPQWAAKRNEVLKRDGRKCTACSSPVNLQVHHLTYERVGDEILEDLVSLCKPCHDKEHQKK